MSRCPYLSPLAWPLLLAASLAAHAAPATPSSAPAPELLGNSWLNLPKGTTLTMASRRGKVTVVHFWTFNCINCKHNLPYYARWQKSFSARGLQIIGIHTPETAAERDPENVAREVRALGITYPVLLDPKAENWKRWQPACWPMIYLVDKQGRVRYSWAGELEYHDAGGFEKMSHLIETLLEESPPQTGRP